MGNRIAKFPVYCFFAMMFMGITFTVDRHAEDMLLSVSIGVQEAQAVTRGEVRRISRRTTRRVNRRHAHYYALPRGCAKVFFNGHMRFYCGGVYYMPQVEQNETVYIIINP
jgi:hypothetical protein